MAATPTAEMKQVCTEHIDRDREEETREKKNFEFDRSLCDVDDDE